MMTNIFKKYLMGIGTCCIAAASLPALTACSEWDDHFEELSTSSGASMTLLQTLQQQPELSDFCEVLKQTKVIRHHVKSSVSYADLLNGEQVFTVMAPLNGTFSKDSLLNLVQTNRGDSMVARSFIANHLSNSLVSYVDSPKDFFLMCNKRATIGAGKVLDVPVVEGRTNISAKGGILHLIKSPLPYRNNLYEAMVNIPEYSLIGKQLSSYERDEFNPNQSVPGDMIDGEQIYADSVFDERNDLLERVGLLAAEDSSFVMVATTNQEWKRVWDEAMEYFRYDSTVENPDSMQRFYANYALLNDAIFSNSIQISPKDSVITYGYWNYYPKYHVFHKPFEKGGIFYGAKKTEFSNGTLYTQEKWPFTPEMTYHREIFTEGENTGLILNAEKCDYVSRTHVADSVSRNAYLDITAKKATDNWTMTFKLENTLAGAYDICLVALPLTVYDPNSDKLRPCKFKATVNYVDENGSSKTFNCNNTQFTTDPTRVDTVIVASDFKFPVCNYGQTNMKMSITLTCSITARETSRYSREMLLDCIFLRPKSSTKE